MSDFFDFYRGKRVLVTGHTGFKGSWLTLLLCEMGATVKGFSLPPDNRENHFNLLQLEPEILHCIGDIRDADHLLKQFDEFQPEIVFHLAAQALVRQSYINPTETYTTNVIGSLNLLEAVRNTESVKALVFVTSDKCYENVEWEWGYRENDRLGGADPYSSSKACAELLFSSYWRSFLSERQNFSASSVRAGNVIGGGDWSENRIVPDCIRASSTDSVITLRNPQATRPWQHVLEPLTGYLSLAMRMHQQGHQFSGAWNFGPTGLENRTVLEVTSAIIELLGKGRIEISMDSNSVHEATLLQLNCDRANRVLKWYPRWNSDLTIQKTAEWYRDYRDGINPKEISLGQLYEYFGVQK